MDLPALRDKVSLCKSTGDAAAVVVVASAAEAAGRWGVVGFSVNDGNSDKRIAVESECS
jgi:hypothetical protein